MNSLFLVLLFSWRVYSRQTFDITTHMDPVPSAVLPDVEDKTAQITANLHEQQIKINGYKSDMVFQTVSKTGNWEPHLLKLSHKLLTNGDEVVFDLGANLVQQFIFI
jgi:hypothetical protein